MSVFVKVKKKHRGVTRAGQNERSLGFVPVLIMTLIYVICTQFADEIGPITSAPGFYRLNQRKPMRGCIMPRASQ